MSAEGPDAADPRERLRAIESAIDDLSRVADARASRWLGSCICVGWHPPTNVVSG